MVIPALVVPLCIVSAVACRGADARRYELRGQIVAVDRTRGEALIKHDAIDGYMDAMTMPFVVRDEEALAGKNPGDLVTGTLVVEGRTAYLTDLKMIGTAPVVTASSAAPASSGFELVRPGEPMPDEAFLDQTGRPRRFAEFRGKIVALTFIYTRCPLPTFCPMMDRHFAAIQKSILADPALTGRVHLVTVSFDPAYDTPEVLRRHARSLGARADVWTFLTGERDAVDRFAARLGVSVVRDPKDARDITHNLRTAVIDREGRLVHAFTGYDWTPSDVLARIRAASEAR